jgi:hypothetical protein
MTDIHNVVPFPPVTPEDAEATGYATFNFNPTLCVDVPDGNFTISAKTSDGRRITFAFLAYERGGAPQAVDIAYHDGDKELNVNKKLLPVFDVIGFGGGPGTAGRSVFDTRDMTKAAGKSQKTNIVCVLMAKPA